jgi:hypothetical protein
MDFENQELGGPGDTKKRAIIDVQEDWSFWQRFAANLLNSAPVVLWLIVTYLLIQWLGDSTELAHLRNAMLNITVPGTAYGVLALPVGVALFIWFIPQFSYRRQMLNAAPIVQAACLIFWGMVTISFGLIIASGIK